MGITRMMQGIESNGYRLTVKGVDGKVLGEFLPNDAIVVSTGKEPPLKLRHPEDGPTPEHWAAFKAAMRKANSTILSDNVAPKMIRDQLDAYRPSERLRKALEGRR